MIQSEHSERVYIIVGQKLIFKLFSESADNNFKIFAKLLMMEK